MSARKKLVIFDCFGVICSSVAARWFARNFPPEEAARLKEKYFDGADRGDVDLATVIRQMARDLNIPEAQLHRQLGEGFTLNRPLLEKIRQLRKTCHVALLSNAPRGSVEGIFDHFDLWDHFDRVFISSHYRMVKPDREFYLLCLDAFRGSYDVAYMIDDTLCNLENLEQIGIQPIHFTDNETLFERLKDLL